MVHSTLTPPSSTSSGSHAAQSPPADHRHAAPTCAAPAATAIAPHTAAANGLTPPGPPPAAPAPAAPGAGRGAMATYCPETIRVARVAWAAKAKSASETSGDAPPCSAAYDARTSSLRVVGGERAARLMKC